MNKFLLLSFLLFANAANAGDAPNSEIYDAVSVDGELTTEGVSIRGQNRFGDIDSKVVTDSTTAIARKCVLTKTDDEESVSYSIKVDALNYSVSFKVNKSQLPLTDDMRINENDVFKKNLFRDGGQILRKNERYYATTGLFKRPKMSQSFAIQIDPMATTVQSADFVFEDSYGPSGSIKCEFDMSTPTK